MFAGTCGLSRGLSGLSEPRTERVSANVEGNRELAGEEAAKALLNALERAPLRRPVAAANVVVSALLLIAAFTLMTGRQAAAWWCTHALVANLLWTIVDAGVQVTRLHAEMGALGEVLERDMQARIAGAPELMAPTGPQVVWMWMGLLAAAGVLRCAVYGLALWRIRRADMTGTHTATE
jgi:hypothetical protein